MMDLYYDKEGIIKVATILILIPLCGSTIMTSAKVSGIIGLAAGLVISLLIVFIGMKIMNKEIKKLTEPKKPKIIKEQPKIFPKWVKKSIKEKKK